MLYKIKSIFNKKLDCKEMYLNFYKNCKIENNTILIEAAQGKNLNGNMFAILRQLMSNEKWKNIKVYFVVTKQNEELAEHRFKYYKFENVNLVIRNTEEYAKLIATAKYFITDNSFPIYFIKKDEQIYLNTWHGTPLKYLGRSDLINSISIGNIQKNYLSADYILFPNEYTRDVFMKDYMLENICEANVLLCDYPRNEVFSNENAALELKQKLGIENKELIAYMPTWRGTGRTADSKKQIQEIIDYLQDIENKLEENQLFYVNMHFLVTSAIDFSIFNKIKQFPSDYETYDFLNCCDTLITDYSSVFFDYAIKNKKIILFAYDEEEYMKQKGMYLKIRELPFSIVKDVDGLIKEINCKNDIELSLFNKEYNRYADSNISEKLLDLLINNENDGIIIEKPLKNGKENVLIHGGNLKNSVVNSRILDKIQELNDGSKNIILSFEDGITQYKVNLLQKLPKEVNFISFVKSNSFNLFWKDVSNNAYILNKKSIEIEKTNILCDIKLDHIIQMALKRKKLAYVFGSYKCKKTAYFLPDVIEVFQYNTMRTKVIKEYIKDKFDNIYESSLDEIIKDEKLDLNNKIAYNKCISIRNIKSIFYNSKNKIHIVAFCTIRTQLDLDRKQFEIKIGNNKYNLDMLFRKGINIRKYRRLNLYHFSIPVDDCINLELHNKILLCFEDNDGYGFEKLIKYKKNNRVNAPVKAIKKIDTAIYFRKTVGNSLYLTVRNANMTDLWSEKIKVSIAWTLSYLFKFKNSIILFEKNSSRYEESASVLFEKLIDIGYENAYFILDKNCSYLSNIKSEYRKNIIYKYSFKHYLYMFCSNTFISSESLAHVCEVRTVNHLITNKLNDTKLNYIFLQHGVMYMLSLESKSRKFFHKEETKGLKRVAVSSQIEANHFIDYAKYDTEDMYICGLPKFDKNEWNKDADKIIIMPTWRPWEYNQARLNFTESKYYKMIERIMGSIPEEYKKNVIVLPHPLIAEAMNKMDNETSKYMNFEDKYDDLLKNAKVLITDYSSIAYDAFYRGSNVIFYWEEKEHCMECYGEDTKLMLNEENCFGDICYNSEDLSKVFIDNYLYNQKDKYIKNYKKIVEFHDGKNTERLIEYLKRDNLI